MPRVSYLGMEHTATGAVAKWVRQRNFFATPQPGMTVVTVDDLFEYLGSVADQMDARLGAAGFTVPVDASASPSGYIILGEVNALGAAAIAEAVTFGSVETRRRTHGDLLREMYEARLRRIELGQESLVDAEGGPIPEKSVADSGTLDAEEDGTEREPLFTRDDEF